MADSLPEELLHEVFLWAYHRDIDDVFLVSCKRYRVSYEINHDVVCSRHKPDPQLLLVCKKWRRVGTPTFYSIVKLHTNEQLRLLARTLESIPGHGLMIRHLCLEGCYERPLQSIAKLTPNVRVLSLQLYIPSLQKKVGLTRALPLWNITDLFIRYYDSRGNKQSTEISLTVAHAMKDQKSLVSHNVARCLLLS